MCEQNIQNFHIDTIIINSIIFPWTPIVTFEHYPRWKVFHISKAPKSPLERKTHMTIVVSKVGIWNMEK